MLKDDERCQKWFGNNIDAVRARRHGKKQLNGFKGVSLWGKGVHRLRGGNQKENQIREMQRQRQKASKKSVLSSGLGDILSGRNHCH